SLYPLEQKYADDVKGKIQVVVDFSQWKAQDFLQTANAEKSSATKAMTGIIVATLLLGLGWTLLVIRSIAPPLRMIVGRIKDIAGGDLSHEVEIVQKDEIGELAESFRDMQASLSNKAEVASAIAGGDFSRMVAIAGNRDVLGNAINQMTLNLRESKEESDRQDWVKTGRNELHSIIVGESDVNALARDIISFLAGYINARIVTLYLMSELGTLTLAGSYSFSKRKSLAAVIGPGEGLVGQAAVEGNIISITNIPEDYIRINSSFGDSPPRNIAAAPFLFENAVKGDIELGAFE